jgi:hypothetical protein
MGPTTIREFAAACKDLDRDGIYELFENGIAQGMRDTLYRLAPKDEPEPVRYALTLIGETFDVQSLIDY